METGISACSDGAKVLKHISPYYYWDRHFWNDRVNPDPLQGDIHSLIWLVCSFCEQPHLVLGPCMKCSITFGSISFQRTAFFSLNHDLLSVHEALPYRNMDETGERNSSIFNPRDLGQRL